ncbi:hypothetical protein Hanom_Chr13g01241001 [Helianthus anomalus]
MYMACKDDEVDDRCDESMYIAAKVLESCIDMSPPMMSLCSEDDESRLVLGDDEFDDDFLSLFFTVEFQKFLISLSVRPGNLVAIWDHLQN